MPGRRKLRQLLASLLALTALGVFAPAGHAAVFNAIAAGTDHTCGVRPGGQPYCWGTGQFGQLGVIGATRARTPIGVIGSYTSTQLASGNGYWCELKTDGKVACTGDNRSGQLGTGDARPQQYPHDVIGLPPASRISVGETTTCAMAAGGVYCWGDGTRGQIGNGQLVDGPSPTPYRVPAFNGVTAVAAGKSHVCVVDAGRVFCWGDTSDSKLGNNRGSAITRPGDDPVVGVGDAVAVAVGDRHSCAIRGGGSVWCWGNPEVGQLGTGPGAVETFTPVQVPGLLGAVQISATATSTCVVKGDGTVWCWGGNPEGKLGNGTTNNSDVPVQVQGVTDATQVSVGTNHACAVTKTDQAFCWGSNRFGQLGSGGLIGTRGVEPTAQPIQDAVKGTARFIPTPIVDRDKVNHGGRVYLRLFRVSRRGSKCPTSAEVTIRARGREVKRKATDIEKVDGGCAVTALLDLPPRTQRAFSAVVVVRGERLKTRKTTLRTNQQSV